MDAILQDIIKYIFLKENFEFQLKFQWICS